MKYQFLFRALLLFMALPVGWWLSCLFLNICNINTLIRYQWPAYLACYLPGFSHLFLDIYFKRTKSIQDSNIEATLTVAPLLIGPLFRLAAIVMVAFYWQSVGDFIAIYSFLFYVVAYLGFQLASLAIVKK